MPSAPTSVLPGATQKNDKSPRVPTTHVTVEEVPAVPPKERVRAPSGGRREEKDTREPYLPRGVVE